MRQTYLAQTGATTATDKAPEAEGNSTLDPIMKRKARAHHADIRSRLTSFTDRYRTDTPGTPVPNHDEMRVDLSGASDEISEASAPLLRQSTQRASHGV